LACGLFCSDYTGGREALDSPLMHIFPATIGIKFFPAPGQVMVYLHIDQFNGRYTVSTPAPVFIVLLFLTPQPSSYLIFTMESKISYSILFYILIKGRLYIPITFTSTGNIAVLNSIEFIQGCSCGKSRFIATVPGSPPCASPQPAS
jgi:hypothetical protein